MPYFRIISCFIYITIPLCWNLINPPGYKRFNLTIARGIY
nr:MAG TPA: hypothetical protein [Caudoviricetes sp.]